MSKSDRIVESLRSHKLVDGLTHNLYSYPARFSPELTREIITKFSKPGDWIFDPYMGGGTSVVQALSMGRNALGIDINSLAYFVARNKIVHLSASELVGVQNWIDTIEVSKDIEYPSLEINELRRLFPKRFLKLLDSLLHSASVLQGEKARRLARFVILKTYHSLLAEPERLPLFSDVKKRIRFEFEKIKLGLSKFEKVGKELYEETNFRPRSRLLNRSIVGLELDKRISDLKNLPSLVFTSPPYPGVHVLYNKWQIASRRETNLPYYISNSRDSFPPAHYTLGGRRSKSGLVVYFDLITSSFASVAKIANKKATIVQLVGFSNVKTQLEQYLDAMARAGYQEFFPLSSSEKRIWRDVPNRKWYSNGRNWDSSKEVLLFHRLKK